MEAHCSSTTKLKLDGLQQRRRVDRYASAGKQMTSEAMTLKMLSLSCGPGNM